MSNEITKELLSDLGDFLRNNKSLKTIKLLGKNPKDFKSKMDFCNEILKLLDSDRHIEIKSIQTSHDTGKINPSISDYKDETDAEMICICDYEK